MLIAIAIGSLVLAQANAASNPVDAPNEYISSLNHSLELIANDDCVAALAILVPALDDPQYNELNPNSKTLVHRAITDCAIKEKQWTEALASINELLKLTGDDSQLLWLKFLIGAIADRPLDSFAAAERLSKTAPERLSDVELRTIWSLIRKLETTVLGDKRREFIDILWKANYTPPDPTASLDALRMLYARLLRDESMSARAASIVREVTHPLEIAEFLFDRRFEAVRKFRDMPTEQDMPVLVERFLDLEKAKMEAHSNRLSAALDFIQALRLAGEFERAEKAAAEIVVQMGETAENSKYIDYEDYANWILNEWAYALYDLGRRDEARATLKKSAHIDESGGPNVSQVINFSSLLVSEGMFDQALTEIAKLDGENASPYGLMWASSVKVCARAFKGVDMENDPDLNFMREHVHDNEASLSRALLCINDIDGAAALYIDRLENAESRIGALSALQVVLTPPYILPYTEELRQRFERVKSRSDVIEAANAVGRILTLPVYPTYWGDF